MLDIRTLTFIVLEWTILEPSLASAVFPDFLDFLGWNGDGDSGSQSHTIS